MYDRRCIVCGSNDGYFFPFMKEVDTSDLPDSSLFKGHVVRFAVCCMNDSCEESIRSDVSWTWGPPPNRRAL